MFKIAIRSRAARLLRRPQAGRHPREPGPCTSEPSVIAAPMLEQRETMVALGWTVVSDYG